MTAPLIERMARALFNASIQSMPKDMVIVEEDVWDKKPQSVHDHHYMLARAALAAIREPSDGMMEAACVYAKDEAAGYAGACYTAMIDAALDGE